MQWHQSKARERADRQTRRADLMQRLTGRFRTLVSRVMPLVAREQVGVSIQAGLSGNRPVAVGVSLLSLIMTLIGFFSWERLGVQRLLATKDAEIKRLRGLIVGPAGD